MRWIKLKTTRTDGFTILELMLAMVFLSFILLFTVTVTVQILRTYNKGLSIKEIEQTGRNFTEEVTRNARLAQGAGSGLNISNVDHGRLCVGGITYVWNLPDGRTFDGKFVNKYQSGDKVGLVKLNDATSRYCDLSKKIPDSAVKLVSDRIRIANLTAVLSDDQRLLRITMDMGTNGDDAPKEPNVDNPNWHCDPANFFGSFCANAHFETVTYLRNGD